MAKQLLRLELQNDSPTKKRQDSHVITTHLNTWYLNFNALVFFFKRVERELVSFSKIALTLIASTVTTIFLYVRLTSELINS